MKTILLIKEDGIEIELENTKFRQFRKVTPICTNNFMYCDSVITSKTSTIIMSNLPSYLEEAIEELINLYIDK